MLSHLRLQKGLLSDARISYTLLKIREMIFSCSPKFTLSLECSMAAPGLSGRGGGVSACVWTRVEIRKGWFSYLWVRLVSPPLSPSSCHCKHTSPLSPSHPDLCHDRPKFMVSYRQSLRKLGALPGSLS